MPEPHVHLSLVLPVHRGVRWIEHNLELVTASLERLDRPFEVIVVCDGQEDLAWRAAVRYAARDPRVRVFHYPQNQGKGFALSFGCDQAIGELVGWLDSDLDVHPDAILAACACLADADVDAAIGSKRHEHSQVDYHPVRRMYSSVYQLVVRALFRLKVRDTQVGAKVFRREVLDVVLPLLLVKRYAFDLEVLAVGATFGFDRVAEVPVTFSHGFGDSTIDWRAVWHMLRDTLAIGYRIHLRHWYARRFAALQRSRAAESEELPFVRVA